MKTKVANVDFSKHFFGCHFNTSNQKENETIDYIFKTYLVKSDEVATIKSIWKNLHIFSKLSGMPRDEKPTSSHLEKCILRMQIAAFD